MSDQKALVIEEGIERRIYLIRGHRVMLSSDLAELYGVEPKVLVQAVNRNIERFPSDFMFRLENSELRSLKSQIVTSNGVTGSKIRDVPKLLDNISKSGSMKGRGGGRHYPYAFTEQGVAMLSSVLRSDRAIAVNIEIMRAFVNLKRELYTNAALAKRLDEMEGKYDKRFRIVFAAIKSLLMPEARPHKRAGFLLKPSK